jgi:hypothetical protein
LLNTTGSYNTATGSDALAYNPTGSYNIAIGYYAGGNVLGNSNNIHIGNQGTATDSGTIRIGSSCPIESYGCQSSAFISGIAGVRLPTANAPLVCINPSTGQLGTVNCASNGAATAQQKVIDRQQEQIQTLVQQVSDLQQRLSRLESLVANR